MSEYRDCRSLTANERRLPWNFVVGPPFRAIPRNRRGRAADVDHRVHRAGAAESMFDSVSLEVGRFMGSYSVTYCFG